jgi:hypothetical protein
MRRREFIASLVGCLRGARHRGRSVRGSRRERRRFACQAREHLAVFALDALVAPIGLAAIRAHHRLYLAPAGGIGDGDFTGAGAAGASLGLTMPKVYD